MTTLTTLTNVKAIAADDENIQALDDEDPAVTLALADVGRIVLEGVYGNQTEMAQRYLAAHLLSLAFTEAGGRGPLSSETIGGITQSWTLPYLNQHTVVASTQYGLMFLEISRRRIAPALVVKSS